MSWLQNTAELHYSILETESFTALKIRNSDFQVSSQLI